MEARAKLQVNYYAYGLKVAAISSRKLGDANEGALKNQYQYQGDYSEFDDETGWNDFELRNYDPVNNVDPSGGLGINFGTIGQITGSVLADRALITLAGAAWGGGAGLAATYVPWGTIGGALGDAGKWVGNGVGNLFQSGAGKELLFKTVVEAAKHWGKTYNDNSIVEGREYGSTIYEETKRGKTSYKYSVPNKASSSGASVKVSKAPDGKKAIADIHSHGNSWGENPGVIEADNNFSSTDKWSNYNQKIDGYLITPDGSLKKYNYRTAKTSVISTDMPSDPKYPKLRKNQIDPFKLPKNEPSVLMR